VSEPIDDPGPRPPEQPIPTPEAAITQRIDEAWADFRGRVAASPAERFGERLDAGWTRKQMLAHVAAWHDLASDRIARFLVTGEKVPLTEEVDAVNARVARAAEGRTAGEIIGWLDDSHGRLRRLAGRMSVDQLADHDGWAAAVIAGDTYEHYAEHGAELEPPAA
jgi:hypothetical protein